MDRLRNLLSAVGATSKASSHSTLDSQQYEPLAGHDHDHAAPVRHRRANDAGRWGGHHHEHDDDDIDGDYLLHGDDLDDADAEQVPFSWLEYSIFLLLGVAMLWAWNMFLASAPYFQARFADSPSILSTFQSAIITVSTVANLGVVLALTHLQRGASYPWRINTALVINVVVFVLLTFSTVWFMDVSSPAYLVFVLLMVAASAWATGLIQNGALAFAASWGRPEYMQAIMTGQGVAGVLPAVAQVIAVLLVSDHEPAAGGASRGGSAKKNATRAAFVYYLAAVVVSVITLLAFIPLVRRQRLIAEGRTAAPHLADSFASIDAIAAGPEAVGEVRARTGRNSNNRSHDREGEYDDDDEDSPTNPAKTIGLVALFRKLHWPALTVFTCFAITMFYPVFTAKILSVRSPTETATSTTSSTSATPRLFQPAVFIPLAFTLWALGDLAGRVCTALPIPLRRNPRALLVLSLARAAFLPLYLLCNIGGRGAAVPSDAFYLIVVQFLFGLTNGWIGSCAMMVSGEMVAEGERAAAGAFMGLCLVAGLAVGSFLSFSVAGV